MDTDGLSGPAQIGEIFVDKEGSMVVIESAFTADEEFDLLDPGGMVDQALEGGTGFIDIRIRISQCDVCHKDTRRRFHVLRLCKNRLHRWYAGIVIQDVQKH